MKTDTGLADRMREALSKTGLTQAEVARRMGGKQQQLSDWLRGRKVPNSTNLGAFAAGVGVSTDWLLYGKQIVSGLNGLNGNQPGLDPQTDALPSELNETDARRLAADGRLFLQELVRCLPRPWYEMTDTEKARVLDQLVEFAFRRRE